MELLDECGFIMARANAISLEDMQILTKHVFLSEQNMLRVFPFTVNDLMAIRFILNIYFDDKFFFTYSFTNVYIGVYVEFNVTSPTIS